MGTGSASPETASPSRLDTAQWWGGGWDSTSISVCRVLPRPCRVWDGDGMGYGWQAGGPVGRVSAEWSLYNVHRR